jgi:enoyl-CoA hydratase/carnithine racemase
MSNTRNEGKIRLVRHSDAFWRVTFDLPPLNIFGPANIQPLEEIVSSLESDDRVKVVVFDSAIDGFVLTHYDFLAKPEESAKFPVGRTGLQALPDMLARLSRASVVSIASIRGRATGVGSELALAAICALPAGKKRFSRNGKSAPRWFQGADPWLDCRV